MGLDLPAFGTPARKLKFTLHVGQTLVCPRELAARATCTARPKINGSPQPCGMGLDLPAFGTPARKLKFTLHVGQTLVCPRELQARATNRARRQLTV